MDEFEQHARTLAVGDDDLDAFGGYLACNALLGDHAAEPETRLAGLYVLTDVGIVADDGDKLRVGIGGVTRVDAVDVAEQDEQVGRHHGGDETESSSLSVNISSVTEMVSFSLTMGTTPSCSITSIQFF